MELADQPLQHLTLRHFLASWQPPVPYDYVLIDCTADLDLITQNAALAADCILMPRGLTQTHLEIHEERVTSAAHLLHLLTPEQRALEWSAVLLAFQGYEARRHSFHLMVNLIQSICQSPYIHFFRASPSMMATFLFSYEQPNQATCNQCVWICQQHSQLNLTLLQRNGQGSLEMGKEQLFGPEDYLAAFEHLIVEHLQWVPRAFRVEHDAVFQQAGFPTYEDSWQEKP